MSRLQVSLVRPRRRTDSASQGLWQKNQEFPKLGDRLIELEAHTMFLTSAMHNMQYDPIWYKQVAGELRVLIADNRPKNRLALLIMEQLGIGLDLHPPSTPPFKWVVLRTRNEIWQHEGNLPVNEYCERGLQASIGGRHYSTIEFVKLVAQNEGSSHESDCLPSALQTSYQIQINNIPAHVMAIECVGRVVQRTCVDLISYAIDNRGYRSRYDWKSDHPLFMPIRSPWQPPSKSNAGEQIKD